MESLKPVISLRREIKPKSFIANELNSFEINFMKTDENKHMSHSLGNSMMETSKSFNTLTNNKNRYQRLAEGVKQIRQ